MRSEETALLSSSKNSVHSIPLFPQRKLDVSKEKPIMYLLFYKGQVPLNANISYRLSFRYVLKQKLTRAGEGENRGEMPASRGCVVAGVAMLILPMRESDEAFTRELIDTGENDDMYRYRYSMSSSHATHVEIDVLS